MYSEAIVDIKDILTEEFSEEGFTHLAINLVNLEGENLLNSTYLNEDSTVYENHVDYIKDIGKYRDSDRKTIVLSIVKLKHSPEKSRTMQRNFIAKHMKDIGADASIVGLYCEDTDVWRISFVKLDYSINVEGIHEELTPAKRYSYLIEPGLHNHTALEQLSKLYYDDSKKATLQDIENAFSVEVVTDEFFKMYKEKYLDLKELLEKDVNFISEAQRLDIEIHDFSEEFAKKLMGQISFLYFLQKKGWLGVKIVPKKISKIELREIYRRQDEETRNIINKVYKPKNEFMVLSSRALKELSNEYAEKLACSFKNTIYDEEWGTGTKTFIRTIFETAQNHDFNFFNEYLEPLFYNALNQKRGSTEYYQLFNCKIPFLNGGLFEPIYKYDWQNVNVQISNEFFSNEDDKGLLDLFDMYNFTINEDEPLEKEVAVDPEMLGKIFENLLEVKERKSKGAFYTPREIVHYMCQESLINYLSNETKIPSEDINLFIKYGEIIKDVDINIDKKEDYKMPQAIIDNLEKIDNALENVTVADPAVGSGAFPLGMLNEIVKARSIIVEYMTKDLIEWQKEDFIRDNKRDLYNLKKDAMKKSIFAVDIEPSAVDITKLRLWLSLVVDSDVKTVNTLPNLDYNIMVGNSLIDEYEGIKLFDEELLKDKPKRRIENKSSQIRYEFGKDNDLIGIGIEQEQEILENIQNLQYELFDEKNTKRKIQIKDEIENKEWELIEYKLLKDNKKEEFKKLEKTRSENRKPYFLWKMNFSKIFKEKGGFDIVIGNPPYGAKLEKKQKESIKNKLKNTNNLNTASIFIDYAKNQWRNKEGIISYIVPKSLLYSESWYSLIESMIKNMKEIIDVEKAFENVKLEQVVFVYNSKENINQYRAKKFLNNTFIKDTMISIDSVYKLKACICDITKEEVDIIKKLDNDKFIEMKEISTTKRGIGIQKLVNEKGQVAVLGGKNLYKFGIDGIYGKINNEDLEKNLKKLKFMKQPKIITQDIIAHIQNPKPHILITSVFDEEGKVLTLDTCQNTVLINNNYDYRYILGLLNSEFISWYTYKFIYCSAIRTMHFDKYYIGKIKIPNVTKDKQVKLIEIVKKIEYYTSKMNNKRDNTYKKELDNLMKKLNVEVFQLYNLNEEEIQIIMDNNCK
ncbi:Eco57I restriction-modification methylase domain-containing protein [Intestinibacter bartlettii]|uniref:Eco57I restriction-modification methylase domain-containing protein n=1 Tax=Intestinibacter bartlettii TaxID=261299 RepID=UPI0039A33461